MINSTLEPDLDVLDALTELVNIGVGHAAASLSELVGERIELTVPRVRVSRNETGAGFDAADAEMATVVMQDFQGRISGRAALAFPQSSALTLGHLLAGGDVITLEFDAELNGILLEVGNIVLNGVLGSLSNAISDQFEYSLPTLFDDHSSLSRLLLVRTDVPDKLIANVEFHVQHREINGTIAVVFGGDRAASAIAQLLELIDAA